ncbi:MAG: hypothetical protein OZ928_21100 [Polyangiaceae bacterium]|nr:hypothetical protein [Polyangiaceae bacterium]
MKQARRSAKEWARLIRAWERSGRTAAQFAEPRGLSPRTLVWWKWRLAHDRTPVTAARTAVQLVPVRIEDEHGDGAGASADPDLAWELAAPSGHVLRVYERGSVQVLREALAIVERCGRRR